MHIRIPAFPLGIAVLLVSTVAVGVQAAAPIEVGTQRQLFADDHIISDMYGIEVTMCNPQKYPGNPLISPQMPWEGGYLSPQVVLYDSAQRMLKMWYTGIDLAGHEIHRTSYAISRDGINWERPNLGLAQFGGIKETNFIPGGNANFIVDERDPKRRYKGVGYWRPGLGVYFSPDGFHWTPYKGNPVIEPTGDTHSLLGWDDSYKGYVGYFRPAGGPRRIGRSVSKDFINWSPIQVVLAPDDHDPVGTQFYRIRVIKYEGVYFGILSVLHIDKGGKDFHQPNPEGPEQTVDSQLVFSRDGIHWKRMGNRQVWLPLGPYQSWDDKQQWFANPLVMGDEIWFYYSGVNVRHQFPDLYLAGTRVAGRWRGGQIGLATLRRDGWVTVRPEADYGWLLTKPLKLKGKTLFVNADASRGVLTVSILDENGQPIPRFDRYSCIHIAKDDTAAPVKWRAADIASLAGRTVRLKFYLRHAALYSFWCE